MKERVNCLYSSIVTTRGVGTNSHEKLFSSTTQTVNEVSISRGGRTAFSGFPLDKFPKSDCF